MRTGSLGLLALLLTGALSPPSRGEEGPVAVTLPAVVDMPPAAPPRGEPKPGPKPEPIGPPTLVAPAQPAAVPDHDPQPCPEDEPQRRKNDDREMFRRDHEGPWERFWFSGGPLLWWIKDGPASPPLVTTSSINSQGALGQPDTVVLFGSETFDFGEFLGGQLRGGTWLDCQHTWGLEFGAFFLEEQSLSASFSSNEVGNPLLARPITNAVTIAQVGVVVGPTGVIIASPGTVAGQVDVFADSQLFGGEINLVRNLVNCEGGTFDVLAGFRYLDLEENLEITSNARVLAPPGQFVAAGTNLATQTVADRFFTRNQFYGGQIGGRYERWRGPLFVSATGKVALGPNHQTVKISGTTTGTAVDGTPVEVAGGLLAVPRGNVGRFTTNWFVVAPELTLSAGVQLTGGLRVSAGFNYLYVNSVARPGSQVNPIVNPALVPSSLAFGSPSGLPQPAPTTKQENFFAHGFHFNVELRY